MADLISPIENGQIIKNSTGKTEATSSNSNLGKDAFLQLLVCQMQNQDPLEPQDNSEYISQLATFSQLESLQNIEGAIGTSQALNLAGKYVDVTSKTTAGNTSVISGFVDYVSVNDGKAYVVIEGNSYLAENITTVYDDDFLKSIIENNGNSNNAGNTNTEDSNNVNSGSSDDDKKDGK